MNAEIGKLRVTCYNCGGEGITDEHDCGEDCCACLYPEPNVRCDICDGKGYWFVEATEENMKKLNKAGLEYGDWEP